VLPASPAAAAGLQAGDRLLRLNGAPVADFVAFGQQVQAAAAVSPQLTLEVERAGQPVTLKLTARFESLRGQPARWTVGIGAPPAESVLVHYGPLKSIDAALDSTWAYTAQTFSMLAKMVTGEASTRNLSSVIGIAEVANASANLGLAYFLQFLAIVSLSLAILNILPIPVLDGGWLLYYFVELVKGSPVSERTMALGQYVGIALLFALMGLAFYNDIQRLWLS